MNELSIALNRIEDWIEIHRPDYLKSILPGKSRDEIEEIAAALPYQLSVEIYTLYQWHNGSESHEQFIPGYCFLPLERAIDEAYFVDSDSSKYTPLLEEIDSFYVFPVFSYDFDSVSTLESNTHRDFSNVLKSIPEDNPSIYSVNLTRMMNVIADCFEIGVYYLDDNKKFIEGLGMLQVLRTHNPELIEFTLDKVTQIKKLTPENITGLYYLIEWFGDSRVVEVLINLLQIPSIAGQNIEKLSSIQDLAIYSLGKLNDLRAVESIIRVLLNTDTNTSVRNRAAEVLGELGDDRAIPALLSSMTDSDERMCRTSIRSLIALAAVDDLLLLALKGQDYLLIQALGQLFIFSNRKGLSLSQQERILSALIKFSNEGSPEIQNIARQSLDLARKEMLAQ